MSEDESLRDAFRQLGYSESLVTSAIQGCGTVERAKQWIEILGPLALGTNFVYEIAMSKIAPEEFLRWREVGFDVLDALRMPHHLAKAGLNVDDYRRWRSAGLGDSIGAFVPQLMSGLSFDELIHILTEWNKGADHELNVGAREFREMLTNRLDLDEFRQQLATGLSGHQIYLWRKARIPSSEWQTWMNLGFDVNSAAEYSKSSVAAAAAKSWAELGLSPTVALRFISAQVPVATAQEWISAGIGGTAALQFIAEGIPLAEAQCWVNSGFSPDEAADYIRNRVAIDEALDFEKRGIASWQVRRTKSGIKLDLDPWQKDPADQLPAVIKRGRIEFTLWTDVLGGDPQGHDIALKWDGHHTVEWLEDISMSGGDLSPGSSSPTSGVASWPNGHDVQLTYSWNDLGLRGYARLADAAPTLDSGGAGGPREWIRFGQVLVEFVLLDLGSGDHEPDELAAEYYCPANKGIFGLDELFRVYLKALEHTEASQEFDEWLRQQLSDGTYITDVDFETLRAEAAEAAAAERARPAPPPAHRRGGLGMNQRRIIELLRAAPADGLNTATIARKLGIADEAVVAATERLEARRMVVLTTDGSIAWLPERRLAWLQAQADSTHSAAEEIAELSTLVEETRAREQGSQ